MIDQGMVADPGEVDPDPAFMKNPVPTFKKKPDMDSILGNPISTGSGSATLLYEK